MHSKACTGVSAASVNRYVFENAKDTAAVRLQLLAKLYDPVTREWLERTGVAAGWSCWEVGAGYGTVARWLHERVGAGGRVVATNIDPRFLEPLRAENLEVRRHDVVRASR